MYGNKVCSRRFSCVSFVQHDDHPKATFLITGRLICPCLFYLSSHQCLFKSEVNLPSTFVNITLVRASKWAAVQLIPCFPDTLPSSLKTSHALGPWHDRAPQRPTQPLKAPSPPCPVLLHPLNWTGSGQGAVGAPAASWGYRWSRSAPHQNPCSSRTLGLDAELSLLTAWGPKLLREMTITHSQGPETNVTTDRCIKDGILKHTQLHTRSHHVGM